MIQEAAGEHLSSLLNAANKTDSEGGRKVRLPSLFQLDEVALVSRVQAAFHVRLAEKVPIPRKMFVELNKYQLPFGSGAFQRGDAIDLETGRFRTPENGVYQFSAQIFLRRKSHEGPRPKRHLSVSGQTRGDKVHHKLFRVLICIDSLCRRNSSLQFITSLEATARVFTAGIHGVLQLTKGQYASVHVDNASHYRLVVLKHSQFSGAMLGQ